MWHDLVSDPRLVFPLAAGLMVATILLAFATWRLQSRRPALVPAPIQAMQPAQSRVDALDPFEHGGTRERRRAHRRTGMAIKVQVQEPNSPETRMEGWVIDRSVGGLGLESAHGISPGTRLQVRTPCQSDSWALVEVKHCLDSGGQYRLGCEFVSIPPTSVLMQFG